MWQPGVDEMSAVNVEPRALDFKDERSMGNRYTNGSYLKRVKDWHANESPWKAYHVYEMIRRHRIPVTSVHDIGCGAGEILVQLQHQLGPAATLTGYDISPQAIGIAKQKENDRLRFFQADYLTTDVQPPDLMLLLDVIEHVPDFIGFLQALQERSQWVIFHVPLDICAIPVIRASRFMLYMRENYGHLHYFTKEIALASIADAGFTILDSFYTDDFTMPSMIPADLKKRVKYEVRKCLYRVNPDLSVSLFPNFNLLLLARGNCQTNV
jgi:SAM-dependent methyltransferase